MIKNASLVGKRSVFVPYSKIKNEIALCLKNSGYVASVSKKTKNGENFIEIELVYANDKPKIQEAVRISKQSKRVYLGVKDIHSIRNGSGILVLSTPKGILSGKEAIKEQVGGEALFKLW
jgi:small subunit ribosomal protein S8